MEALLRNEQSLNEKRTRAARDAVKNFPAKVKNASKQEHHIDENI